jgi:hypothetical protein
MVGDMSGPTRPQTTEGIGLRTTEYRIQLLLLFDSNGVTKLSVRLSSRVPSSLISQAKSIDDSR